MGTLNTKYEQDPFTKFINKEINKTELFLLTNLKISYRRLYLITF